MPARPPQREPLAIDPLLDEIVAQTRAHGRLVLLAPPGAGKTTRVPAALLDAALAEAAMLEESRAKEPTPRGRIIVSQPRRLAARAAAARIAAERQVELGGEVGYQVRFESCVGPATRLVVVTEGILIRMLADDPFLEGIDVLVFDEFHERSLHADLALAMARRVRRETRPDLKIVVMSATLDMGPIAEFLGEPAGKASSAPAPSLVSQGRAWPVAIEYLLHEPSGPLDETMAKGVERMTARIATGDVLVFLPGVGEIHRTAALLSPLAHRHGWTLSPLHGEMPLGEQQAVLRPGPRRKIVLATNVAETSLTIEGVEIVVDSGWARQMQADPETGFNRLALVRISKASAEQRAGRAGRTGPGHCLRLWTERRHHALEAHATPEIQRVDLAGAALELLVWGERDLGAFGWFERPSDARLTAALALLADLGAAETIAEHAELSESSAIAIRSAKATALGRRMARWPVHPRLARLLIEGQRLGALGPCCLAAAILSERDAMGRLAGPGRWSDSDVLDRIKAIEEAGRGPRGRSGLDSVTIRHLLRVADDLERSVESHRPRDRARQDAPTDATSDLSLRRALLAAFPDRVVRRREPGSERGLMVGGRGVRLDAKSAVREAELFIAIELHEARGSEALVRVASAIERRWLPAEQLTTAVDVEFDAERERVVAWRRVRWRDLVLEEAATNLPADARAAERLAAAALERKSPRDWLDARAERLLGRLDFLRRAMPELQLPAWSDEQLGELLPRLCEGCVSFADLSRRSFEGPILETLDSVQRLALDREAPERLRLPSGSQATLDYPLGKAPVLAVRIQEIFGWTATPRLAAGRAPVLLHLLSPSMRPQQITDDLASFWSGAYAEVRKELRRRYPKHAWPEDPLQARAERRPTKR